MGGSRDRAMRCYGDTPCEDLVALQAKRCDAVLGVFDGLDGVPSVGAAVPYAHRSIIRP